MNSRQCPRCHDSMAEAAGDLHCLACGYVADVPMEAWDECEAQKDARIEELQIKGLETALAYEDMKYRADEAEFNLERTVEMSTATAQKRDEADAALAEAEATIGAMETDREKMYGTLDYLLLRSDNLATAEAENERLRKGLRLIIERPPGQAHRIAIQMLGAERSAP